MSEAEELWTKTELNKMGRDEIDEVAVKEFDLEPSEYRNKPAMVAAILTAQDGSDGDDVEKLETGGKMQHTGGWVVQSQCRYLNNQGKAVYAKPFKADEYGIPILDKKGKQQQNVITDVPFGTAKKLHRSGVLAPHLE